MAVVLQIAGPVSKVMARLHQWYGVAWLLSRWPLARLDETATGRLRYALMMSKHTRPGHTRRLLMGLIRRSEPASPELQIELAAMATVTGLPDTATGLLLQARQAATEPHTADAAEKLLHLSQADADGTLRIALQRQIAALALPTTSLLTLVPVSGKYLELWHIWLGQVRRHVGGHVIAMTMDDAAWTALSGRQDVAVVDVREFFSWSGRGKLHPHTRGVLWYLRVLLLRELVQQGQTVLVLDLDAMPLSDLQPMLAELPTADVIAQKDHSIPMDVDRKLGFVLCCGFMLWRPTKAAQRLLDLLALETAVERDDQFALNHLLLRLGVEEKKEQAGNLYFEVAGTQFVCPDPAQVSRSIESGSVIRHFHQTGQSIHELKDLLGL